MSGLILIWFALGSNKPGISGASTYILLWIYLSNLIPRDHKKGMRLIKKTMFEEAISSFEKSYAFFRKHAWLDEARFVTMLSSSKTSYKEMALVNIAFCYAQLGNVVKCREYYQRALEEFPDSGLARYSLKMLDTFEGRKE